MKYWTMFPIKKKHFLMATPPSNLRFATIKMKGVGVIHEASVARKKWVCSKIQLKYKFIVCIFVYNAFYSFFFTQKLEHELV